MKQLKWIAVFAALALQAPAQNILGKHPADKVLAQFFNQNGNADAVVDGLNTHATHSLHGTGTLTPTDWFGDQWQFDGINWWDANRTAAFPVLSLLGGANPALYLNGTFTLSPYADSSLPLLNLGDDIGNMLPYPLLSVRAFGQANPTSWVDRAGVWNGNVRPQWVYLGSTRDGGSGLTFGLQGDIPPYDRDPNPPFNRSATALPDLSIGSISASGDVTFPNFYGVFHGTLDGTLLGGMDASQIVSGILDPACIPNLDASKLTAGTLQASVIPGLDAGQIIGGTLNLGGAELTADQLGPFDPGLMLFERLGAGQPQAGVGKSWNNQLFIAGINSWHFPERNPDQPGAILLIDCRDNFGTPPFAFHYWPDGGDETELMSVTADGDMNLMGGLNLSGALYTGGDVLVNGSVNALNGLYANTDSAINGNLGVNTLNVGSDTYIGGSANVGNNIYCAQLNANDAIQAAIFQFPNGVEILSGAASIPSQPASNGSMYLSTAGTGKLFFRQNGAWVQVK